VPSLTPSCGVLGVGCPSSSPSTSPTATPTAGATAGGAGNGASAARASKSP
jgi:hypothetical protein